MTLTTEQLKTRIEALRNSASGIVSTFSADADALEELLRYREALPVTAGKFAGWGLYHTKSGEFGNWLKSTPESDNSHAISQGYANVKLYTAPPAPAAPDKPRLPPHVYRDLLDMLQEAAIAYGGTQQLRARLSSALSIHVQPDHPHTRAAMLKGEKA